MKKLFALLVVTILALSVFAGCSSTGETFVYEDGTFAGYSSFNRGYAKATVTIKNDEITYVALSEFDGNGILKDYATYSLKELRAAHTALATAMAKANSVDVDDFTGATSTSNKAKEAVAQALAKAEVNGSGLTDGTFFARGEIGERGYSAVLVTIEEGVISEVELWDTEGNLEDGFTAKPEDYRHVPYLEAKEALAAAMEDANSADVDTYTNATNSSNQWINAVKTVLEMATK